MKRLFLLRHAESGWGKPNQNDFDRTLSMHGKRTAPLLGRHIQRLGYAPAIALCSPAQQTRETWGYVSEALNSETPEELRPEFYLVEPGTLLDATRTLKDARASTIVIKHNPGILALALSLATDDIRAANPFGEYPVAALAVFDFDVASWSALQPGGGTLIRFTRPDEL